MTTDEIKEQLRQRLTAFRGEEFCEMMMSKSCLVEVAKGEKVNDFQSKNKRLFYILQGSVMTNYVTDNNETRTIMFHTEKFLPFFKSYDTFFLKEHTHYEMIANEPTMMLSIDFEPFYQYVLNDLVLLQYYTHQTEELFMYTELFRNNQMGLDAKGYMEWLYEHFRFLFQRFPAQAIASFMGITPSWLSRLKAQ